jgi:hypothetical protein
VACFRSAKRNRCTSDDVGASAARGDNGSAKHAWNRGLQKFHVHLQKYSHRFVGVAGSAQQVHELALVLEELLTWVPSALAGVMLAVPIGSAVRSPGEHYSQDARSAGFRAGSVEGKQTLQTGQAQAQPGHWCHFP